MRTIAQLCKRAVDGAGLLAAGCGLAGYGWAAENEPAVWQDTVTFRIPGNAEAKERATRAADWLRDHRVAITAARQELPVQIIAWKDPTLEPGDPRLLAGYLITDTLWAAKALQPFDAAASRGLEHGLQRLGWPGNGLHDVLFHPLDRLQQRPADEDTVHGHSLGRFPIADGQSVDVRVLREKWDPAFAAGQPALFAEHAVYQAIYDFWQHRQELARHRVLEAIADHRAADPADGILWDAQAGILVDRVNRNEWIAFHRGERAVCRHYTFKLGVLLYAVRLFGMEREIGPPLEGMKRRLWSAQSASGGLAHFVDVKSDGVGANGLDSTGEATAIAILAETIEPQPRGVQPVAK